VQSYKIVAKTILLLAGKRVPLHWQAYCVDACEIDLVSDL